MGPQAAVRWPEVLPAGFVRKTTGLGMELFRFVQLHKEEIIHRWEQEVARLPGAVRPEPILRDSIPALLDLIARHGDRDSGEVTIVGEMHALQRLEVGFDLWTVATEYHLLRSCIVRLWLAHGGHGESIEQVMRLDDALDRALTEAVSQYSQSRNRTLEAVDRISTVALEEHDIDSFLGKLITVFTQTVPSVQTAAILLRDSDDTFVLRAAVGFEAEVGRHERVRIGEGFAGSIAACNEPMTIHDAAHHPLPKSKRVRTLGVKVLHGVPMRSEGQVIGVAHIGSREIDDFSAEDRALFAAMVGRAASAVVMASLRAREREARFHAQRAEERLTLAAEAAQMGTWDLDIGSRDLRCDRACKSLLGFASDAQTPLDEVLARVHPDDLDRIRSTVRDALTDSGEHRLRFEFRSRCPKDSSERWLEMRGAFHVDDSAAATRLLGTLIDVTESHRYREELEREAAFRERFIAILSHDLRNPLSAIVFGASTLARPGAVAEWAARSVDRILSAAGRANRMVGDLLDFARIRQHSGLPIEPTKVRVADVVSSVIDEIRAAHPGRQIDLVSTGGCEGEWDPDRIAQVVSNLVGNAVRHSPPDAAVGAAVTSCPESVELSVHNEKSTIPAEAIPTLFDPFKRSESGTSKTKGLGLGLYISREIVHAHGGKIAVDSDASRGTTFVVTLPRRAPTVR